MTNIKQEILPWALFATVIAGLMVGVGIGVYRAIPIEQEYARQKICKTHAELLNTFALSKGQKPPCKQE